MTHITVKLLNCIRKLHRLLFWRKAY